MKRALRALVAIALLGVLAAGIDWDTVPHHLARLNWMFAALAFVTIGLELVVNASKWLYSLKLHDLHFPWPFLLRTSCVAYFANNFLPSAIGGDVYRVYRTISPGGQKSGPISAVLIERAVGLGAMLCLGAVGALVLAGNSELAAWYLRATAAAIMLALLILVGFYFGWFKPLIRWLQGFKAFAPVDANLRRILRPRREWLWLIVLSFAFQALAAAFFLFSFHAVGAPITPARAALISAAAGIASVLPISISGLGVVEGAIAGAGVALGVAYDLSVLAAIAARLLVLPASALCGLAYLFDSPLPRQADDEKVEQQTAAQE